MTREVTAEAMRDALVEIANRAANFSDPDAADWMPSIYVIACKALGEPTRPEMQASIDAAVTAFVVRRHGNPDRGDSPTIPIYAPTLAESENDNSKSVGDFTRVLKDQGMLDQDGRVKR